MPDRNLRGVAREPQTILSLPRKSRTVLVKYATRYCYRDGPPVSRPQIILPSEFRH